MFKTGERGRLWSLSPGCQAMRQSAAISARQLTPVTYNHRLRWLAAVAPRDRFLCSDTAWWYQFLIALRVHYSMS